MFKSATVKMPIQQYNITDIESCKYNTDTDTIDAYQYSMIKYGPRRFFFDCVSKKKLLLILSILLVVFFLFRRILSYCTGRVSA